MIKIVLYEINSNKKYSMDERITPCHLVEISGSAKLSKQQQKIKCYCPKLPTLFAL
jgi:hypothetical protein